MNQNEYPLSVYQTGHAGFGPPSVNNTQRGNRAKRRAAINVRRNALGAILVVLVGLAPIYRAFRPAVRNFTLAIATGSKPAFISLVVSYGFSKTGAGVSIWIDAAFIRAFLIYLISSYRQTGHT